MATPTSAESPTATPAGITAVTATADGVTPQFESLKLPSAPF